MPVIPPRTSGIPRRIRSRAGRSGAIAAVLLAAAGLAGCGSSRAPELTSSTPAARGPAPHVSSTTNQNWPMFGYDAQRTDAGPASTGIDAGDAGRLARRTVRLPGIADSSAIALDGVTVRGARHDVIVLTTSYGTTLALDARTGRRLWTFRPHGVDTTPGNPQVTTASPAADPGHRAVYAAAPNGRIYRLSLASGVVEWSRAVTFDPKHEKIASSLGVSGSQVLVQTGGYDGDIPPYDGHVVTLERSTGRIVHVWNSECSDRHLLIRADTCRTTDTRGDNAMWGRAGIVVVPGSGRLLTATGNGPFDGHTSWGSSVLELSPNAARLVHNWTPTNQAELDRDDLDVGSTSPALLGRVRGLSLALQGGKDGLMALLDLNRLDGSTGPAGPRLGGQLSQVSTPGGDELLTAPAVWRAHGTTWVFAGDDSGTAGYRLQTHGRLRLQRVWSDGSPATSPVVAGGLLYAYDAVHGELDIRRLSSGALIHAYPVPTGHWNSPIVSDGRVILPTGSYHTAASSSALEILHLPGR